jgi:hypothetical protein
MHEISCPAFSTTNLPFYILVRELIRLFDGYWSLCATSSSLTAASLYLSIARLTVVCLVQPARGQTRNALPMATAARSLV